MCRGLRAKAVCGCCRAVDFTEDNVSRGSRFNVIDFPLTMMKLPEVQEQEFEMSDNTANLQTIANLVFIYKKVDNMKDIISESLMNLSKTVKSHLRLEGNIGYNTYEKDA